MRKTLYLTAATALMLTLVAPSHASHNATSFRDANGPKPFAECADLHDMGVSMSALTEPEFDPNDEGTIDGDQNSTFPGLDPEEGQRRLVTELRVDLTLWEAPSKPCLGSDGQFGTDDDRVAYTATLFDKSGNALTETVDTIVLDGIIVRLTFTLDEGNQFYIDAEEPPDTDYSAGAKCAEGLSRIVKPAVNSDYIPDKGEDLPCTDDPGSRGMN